MYRFFAMILVLTLPISACTPAVQHETYFPPDQWGGIGNWEAVEHQAFNERWYGKQLAAMDEPSLLSISKNSPHLRVYRLLVLPSFSPAYAVRVVITANKPARAHFVYLDGAGGYAPGKVSRKTARAVSDEKVERIEQLFSGLGFWSPPTVASLNEERRAQEHGCVDGTKFVLEATASGAYQLRDRHNCAIEEKSDLRALIDLMEDVGVPSK